MAIALFLNTIFHLLPWKRRRTRAGYGFHWLNRYVDLWSHFFQFMLIDGGPGKSYDRYPAAVKTTYRTTEHLFTLLTHLSTDPNRTADRQLKCINTVVLTHDDEDHKNGMFGSSDYYAMLSWTTLDPNRNCRSFQIFVSLFCFVFVFTKFLSSRGRLEEPIRPIGDWATGEELMKTGTVKRPIENIWYNR